MTSRAITLEAAQTALEDRTGDTVVVTLEVILEAGGTSRVMAAVGELAPWHSAHSAWAWSGEPRRDVRGVYAVGDATIDLTSLRPASILEHDGKDYGLMFDLDDRVVLTVAWKTP